MNFADKVRPGETLQKTLLRIVKDELKVAPDFEGARVRETIEFDKDKEGILTPRLTVLIFLKEYTPPPEVIEKSQRGWTSIPDVAKRSD